MPARICLFGLVVLLSTVALQAQSGAIVGTVRDPSGGVLPGVTVEVRSPALVERVRSTVTGADGRYRIVALPAGTYEVRFTLSAFSSMHREGIVVTSDATTTVDVELHLGAVTEEVIVAAAAPAVDVTTARSVTVFSGGDIRDMPTARNLSSLMLLTDAPGINRGLVALQSAQGQLRVDGMLLGAADAPGDPATRAGETYADIVDNVFVRAGEVPLSTFSIDVDTAAYANVRRFLSSGTLPPRNAVRIEELVNYFRFDYPQPRGGEPFSITTELAEAPWNPAHRLVLVGLQGREIPARDLPARNLVFLIDVSGSMAPPDRLPLVKQAMLLLTDTLRPRDRVAIVVYAGESGVVLPSTSGDRKMTIREAVASLRASGSTNGGQGIQLAYQIAREQFTPGGVNRVILATDGDFNVGITRREDLLQLIEEERQSGVFLSVLGVGTGNLRDDIMEMLANAGNGNYSYLDTLQEARKVLVQEAGSTLVTIASDVKIQVEFNPATVAAYRLIGYENRLLAAQDFNDDTQDAGEVGAGHSVTALYEIVPAGAGDSPALTVDPLRYQPVPAAARFPNELLMVKVRYKTPGEDRSRLLTSVVRKRLTPLSANLGFASAVAEFGLLLRGAHHQGVDFDALIARARQFRGDDAEGYRAEFIRLAETAASLQTLTLSRAGH